MLSGVGAREKRYQYYDEDEADRAALLLSQIDRENTAQMGNFSFIIKIYIVLL